MICWVIGYAKPLASGSGCIAVGLRVDNPRRFDNTTRMSPIILIPIGLVIPVVIASIVLVPSYAGFYYATKIIYGMNDVDLSPYALHVFYIMETYITLFEHWINNISTVDHISYSLPLLILPIIGIAGSAVGGIIFTSYIMTIFQKME